MQETSSLGWEDLLKEEVANHYGIPAWRIPWTEEAGRLQSIESQTDKTRTHIRKKAGEDFLCYKISYQPHYLLSLS